MKDFIIELSALIFSFLISYGFDVIKASWYLIPVLTLFWIMFDRYLFRLLPACLLRKCYIGGNWKGKLYSSFKVKGIRKNISKNVEISIKQKFSSIDIFLKSNEMIGKNIVYKWDFSNNRLFYIYKTDPNIEFKDKNPIQYGAAQVKFTLNNKKELRIEYWTDRNTKGYIKLKKYKF